MLERYKRELAYLRALAREVADAYPEIEYLVRARGGDDSVERLLQGTAFLTAHLEHVIEDDIPEIVQPFFASLYPQFLRPLPAATMVQFSDAKSDRKKALRLPPGLPIASGRASSEVLGFRTQSAAWLYPFVLEGVDVARPRPAEVELRLSFALTGGVDLTECGVERLAIAIAGPPKIRAQIYFLLTRRLGAVSLFGDDDQPLGTLPSSAVQPTGLDPSEALMPFRPTPIDGFRLLEEYFHLRAKFYGVSLSGFDRIEPGRSTKKLTVVFRFPLDDLEVSPVVEHFRLGVAPAVNLSDTLRSNLDVRTGLTMYRLEPQGGGEIFEVEKVSAFDTATREWVDYEPLFSGRRRGLLKRGAIFYDVVRQPDGLTAGQPYLALFDHDGRPVEPRAERISVWFTATGGAEVLEISAGDLRRVGKGAPAFVEVENITGITPPCPSVASTGRLWELLALFASPASARLSTSGLRRLLGLALPPGSELPSRLITAVQTSTKERIHHRALVPVRRIVVTVNESALDDAGEPLITGPGDLSVLGQILHSTFAHWGDDRSACELEIRTSGSNDVHRFGGLDLEEPAVAFRPPGD